MLAFLAFAVGRKCDNGQPYIIENYEVTIQHFKDNNAGPDITKFKGFIQCQQ